MTPNKLNPQAARRPHRRKTTADFLRWLKKRRALEKLEAEKQAVQETKEALMVWVDDGGSPT